ncbi:3-oxoacyl-[acyl-carrier-protein] reductase FabG [Micromonospora sp. MH33]|uniref:SDR family NAD(P)-dependent oxidoreductase n=1 Tax=Micromonospora sp. MH33 TaxID=1945509 RepID=UPI000D14A957|nr:SDR family oxidoreductase [Micromonospora sp. MH33]PSK67138.1 3-oxoacyl-[acyl-carrier-protein] reductase FabG [Micromonospora sp. MH33]
MDLQLKDRVILVTGASTGIGRATAELLAAEGATAVGVSRNPAPGISDPQVDYISADLTARGAGDRIVETILERHGRLDGLVNNLGGPDLRNGFLGITEEQWLDMFDLNFHVARRMSKAALPALLAAGDSAIVHVSSSSAHLGTRLNPDYAAAKLALLSLSKTLAAEFTSKGTRSNVVTPGLTRTAIYEAPGGFGEKVAELHGVEFDEVVEHMSTSVRPQLAKRVSEPEDVARVIAYLISPLASQVTGAEWVVDSGVLMQV